MNVLKKEKNIFYKNENFILLQGDVIENIKNVKSKSVDMIFADPPYFLSNDGITCSGGKMVSVNKGEWDKKVDFREKHLFNKKWIKECYRVLDDNGTIWISGTFHNIFSVGVALEENGFKIINNITWQKTNPPPNLACKCFTHSTETIIWARKDIKTSKYFFNYKLMKKINGDKQMKDVWSGSLTKKSEKKYGKHPTQKPEYLLERIILSSTQDGNIVLDPFSGSGTTGSVCVRIGRKFVGIEKEIEYVANSLRRIKNEEFQ